MPHHYYVLLGEKIHIHPDYPPLPILTIPTWTEKQLYPIALALATLQFHFRRADPLLPMAALVAEAYAWYGGNLTAIARHLREDQTVQMLCEVQQCVGRFVYPFMRDEKVAPEPLFPISLGVSFVDSDLSALTVIYHALGAYTPIQLDNDPDLLQAFPGVGLGKCYAHLIMSFFTLHTHIHRATRRAKQYGAMSVQRRAVWSEELVATQHKPVFTPYLMLLHDRNMCIEVARAEMVYSVPEYRKTAIKACRSDGATLIMLDETPWGLDAVLVVPSRDHVMARAQLIGVQFSPNILKADSLADYPALTFSSSSDEDTSSATSSAGSSSSSATQQRPGRDQLQYSLALLKYIYRQYRVTLPPEEEGDEVPATVSRASSTSSSASAPELDASPPSICSSASTVANTATPPVELRISACIRYDAPQACGLGTYLPPDSAMKVPVWHHRPRSCAIVNNPVIQRRELLVQAVNKALHLQADARAQRR
jgi:hypothetical protein